MASEIATFFAEEPTVWREWLSENHTSKKEIWLVFTKKGSKMPCVRYDSAVEEALCFGWVDGLVRKLDESRYACRFTPRKPNSVWSESNKIRVTKLIEQGRMTQAGMALIDAAKANGQWDKVQEKAAYDDCPKELTQALDDCEEAKNCFRKLTASHQREWNRWVGEAKKEETRTRRASQTVERLLQGTKRPE